MILLDYAILISMIVTIIYCWKLNNRVTELRNSRKELQEIFSSFNYSLEKAEENIRELKDLGTKTSIEMNQKLEQAKFLIDDLAFMTDRANNLANKLEKNINYSKNFESDNNDVKKKQIQSFIEKQYTQNKSVQVQDPKRSTIESLLAKIAAVKENNKKSANIFGNELANDKFKKINEEA